MRIEEHKKALDDIRQRLEKAKDYKSKYKHYYTLLDLVECQTLAYSVAKTKGNDIVQDFGGIVLINSMLNEWDRLEEKQRAAARLENK